jgi:hypothetical protein
MLATTLLVRLIQSCTRAAGPFALGAATRARIQNQVSIVDMDLDVAGNPMSSGLLQQLSRRLNKNVAHFVLQ